MNEASKTRAVRSQDFYARFFSGTVLDIGCGPDLVVPNAQPFDMEHGDANCILNYFGPESFDTVHSSHALEHMHDPVQCLSDWWKLVRPGGYMITVVPDAELYEQGCWPSIFNPDHKSRFSLSTQSLANKIFNIRELVDSLPGASVVSVTRQDSGYRRPVWRLSPFRNVRPLVRAVARLRASLLAAHKTDGSLDRAVVRMALIAGIPVDQTIGSALAQIEVVLQKKRST